MRPYVSRDTGQCVMSPIWLSPAHTNEVRRPFFDCCTYEWGVSTLLNCCTYEWGMSILFNYCTYEWGMSTLLKCCTHTANAKACLLKASLSRLSALSRLRHVYLRHVWGMSRHVYLRNDWGMSTLPTRWTYEWRCLPCLKCRTYKLGLSTHFNCCTYEWGMSIPFLTVAHMSEACLYPF